VTVTLPGPTGTVGNLAGWRLQAHNVREGVTLPQPAITLTERETDAEIWAHLPGGLEPGSYTLRLPDLSDENFGVLSGSNIVLRLWLTWRDAPGALPVTAGVDALAGTPPMAEAAVTGLVQRPGQGSWDTVVTARERVYDTLAVARVATPITATDPLVAAIAVAGQSVEVRGYADGLPAPPGVGLGPSAGGPPYVVEAGVAALDVLADLGGRIEEATGRFGRGPFLQRAGVLHVGVRPVPLVGVPTRLDPGGGLIDVRSLGVVRTDPFAGALGGADADRRQLAVLLKGRPDIRPGDVVQVVGTAADAGSRRLEGLLGGTVGLSGAGSSLTTVYVSAVTHELSRRRGFVSTVVGVELAHPADAWDTRTRSGRESRFSTTVGPGAGSRVVQAIRSAARGASEALRLIDVGEVRRTTTSGTAEPPSHTTTVWRGLGPGDGAPNQARRLPVNRDQPAPLAGTPYVTSFAWGRCGLVLPRYPGTRVVLGHRNGWADDPVDLGAVWPSGEGPDAQPGDWWLGLPVDVPQPASAPPSGAVPGPSGVATNDLVDGKGNRVIEVGALRIRVGKGALQQAGTRPQPRTDDVLVAIEHSDNETKVLVHQDGTVEISSKKDLNLTGQASVTVNSPKINLGNDKSTVSVPGKLDVGTATP
jgi:hypothetical protein